MKVGDLEIVPVLDGSANLPADRLLRFTGTRDDPWGPLAGTGRRRWVYS